MFHAYSENYTYISYINLRINWYIELEARTGELLKLILNFYCTYHCNLTFKPNIIPVDDRTDVSPVTFVEITTLNFVRADIGYMVWSACKVFVELDRRGFDFNIRLQLF